MRITWGDGTPVDVYITTTGENKSRVAVQHRKLADKTAVATMKEYWDARLDALVELLRARDTVNSNSKRASDVESHKR